MFKIRYGHLEMHESLKRAQADLIQSEKLASLGTLAAGIAHEINNAIYSVSASLGPIKKHIGDLEESPQKVKYQKYVDVMSEGLDLTINIVQSLRNYTSLNKAKFDFMDLEKVIRSVLTLLQSRIPATVTIKLSLDNEVRIFGSTVGFHQIFTNLITNAVDAMPKGGILLISSRKDGDYCELTVRDEGEGIPDEIKDRVFDPFFTTKPVGLGTGLGLHIVHGEIVKHNGSIQLTSELGKGTTFTMKVPLQTDKLIQKTEAAFET
jgi:signal transduction histidine kinase